MSRKHTDFVHRLITAEKFAVGVALLAAVGAGCMSSAPEGIAPAAPAATTVKFDFEHLPLPEIPLPNDVATVYDASSPTLRRINASMIAPTGFERGTRELTDKLDGWGTFQPISIPFTGPLDVESIRAGHRDPYYETDNDVVYVINIDRSSPEFGKLELLDIGNGNYPIVLKKRNNYWDNDTRADTMSILFDEVDEDMNGNGVLDPGEDTDADGILDKPNYFPGKHPAADDLAGRADAMMTFYERETNTLIVRVLKPLRERTVYAVVVTRRIHDAAGNPVGSPYPFINHTAQTEALRPLAGVLPHGLSLSDVAFAFSFTTQSVASHWRAVRDGLYGYGVQRHLATEYPPKLDALLPLRDAGSKFPNMTRPELLYGENWLEAVKPLASQFLGTNTSSEEYHQLADSLSYIDYFIVGRYESPQLFPRRDAQGHLLPLNDQSWPPDLDSVAAPARSETVYVTFAVPRKEVSVRGQGKPAPVVILSHGYGGQRFPIMQLAGYFARHGMATVAIDGPSHGIGLPPDQDNQARQILGLAGYGKLGTATLLDRAFDQDNDRFCVKNSKIGAACTADAQCAGGTCQRAGVCVESAHDGAFCAADADCEGGRCDLFTKDSGADFWTSYLFHTRDVVRQFMLDYSQLIRIMRSWSDEECQKNPDATCGDFDGDGAIDVGGPAPAPGQPSTDPSGRILMTGGSLGGIMSMAMGGAEPQITAIAPIAGGGGYADMGMRTEQGGAIEGFVLRLLGPLFTGVIDSTAGVINMQIEAPELNHDGHSPLGSVAGVQDGDTLVVENLVSGVRGCGLVQNGRVRASLQCDGGVRLPDNGDQVRDCSDPKKPPCGDRVRIVFYKGAVQLPEEGCFIAAGASVRGTLEKFGSDFVYQGETFHAGEPLRSTEDGLGRARNTPEVRRLQAFAQLVMDPGDPIVYAPHLQDDPIEFATGERTGAHALTINSQGDVNVPENAGVAYGRAAGIIDYLHRDSKYNQAQSAHAPRCVPECSEGQVLVDTYTVEAVDNLKRFTDSTGKGVHLDIENFSGGNDIYGPTYPRLDPPSRIGFDRTDKLGGKSAAIFPLARDTGQHGFDFPGVGTDAYRAKCKVDCTQPGSTIPCSSCATATTYDIGSFMFNMLSHYLVTNGTELNPDLCNSRGDCDYLPPAPPARNTKQLP